MKFQVLFFCCFFTVALSQRRFVDDRNESRLKVTRKVAADFFKAEYNKEKNYSRNPAFQPTFKCIKENLNITDEPESYVINFQRISLTDLFRLQYVYEVAAAKICFALDFLERMGNLRVPPGQFSDQQIQCKKLKLWKLKPRSELLKNFDASRVQNSICEESVFDSSELEEVKESFNQFNLTKCSEDDFLYVKDMKIDAIEGLLMSTLDSEEVSAEKLDQQMRKVKIDMKNFLGHQIACIMSEFEEN